MFYGQKEKTRYFLTFHRKQPIGFVEVIYLTPAMHTYRMKIDRELRHKQNQGDCMFIRATNWRRIFVTYFDNKTTSQSMEDFQNSILINYIENIYFPMKNTLPAELVTSKRRRESKMIKNIVNIFHEQIQRKPDIQDHLIFKTREDLVDLVIRKVLNDQHHYKVQLNRIANELVDRSKDSH